VPTKVLEEIKDRIEAHVNEFGPISDETALGIAADAGLPEKSLKLCLLERADKHRRRRWIHHDQMLYPLPAGDRNVSPADGSSTPRSPDLSPVAAAKPIPSMDSVQERLASTMVMLKFPPQKVEGAAYFLAETCDPDDPASFQAGVADCSFLSQVERSMLSKTWLKQNGHAVAVPAQVALREQSLFVAVNGEIQPVDPRDPGAVPFSVAVHNADAQNARMTAAAPVPGPDLAELLGIPAIDLVRGALLGGEPSVIAGDADSAIRVEDSRRRWALFEGVLAKLPGVLEDGIKAWREGGKGEIRRRVLSHRAEAESEEPWLEIACGGCLQSFRYQASDGPVFDCPACGSEILVSGNEGDVFSNTNDSGEVGYGEESTGPGPAPAVAPADEPGQRESSRSRRSGVSAEARVGGADS